MGEQAEILRFSVESVTPLIISGADNNGHQLEKEGLRPPSVRGALRWWFRAMMTSIIDTSDRWEVLRNLESAAFGSTGQQSPLQLRSIALAPINDYVVYVRMNDPEAFKLPNGRPIQSPTRAALKAGSRFQLQMTLHDSRISSVVLGSLWLLAMLSGVGARTRRGFGSILLNSQDQDTMQVIENLQLPLQLSEGVNNASNVLAGGIAKVQAAFAQYAGVLSTTTPLPHFPSLRKDQCKCWLITKDDKHWTTWEDCMNDLRDDIYRGFKRELGRRELGKPSPLHIQVKHFSEGDHYGVLTAFQYDQIFGRDWTKLNAFLKGLHNYRCAEVALP